MSSVNKPKHDAEAKKYIASEDWNKLLEICEDFEFEVVNDPNPPVPNYGIQLLSYLIVGDLDNARFLWKRIPSNIKSAQTNLKTIWKIGQAMWTRNYIEFYKTINGNWDPIHKPLVEALLASFRRKTFFLLSKAYDILSVNDACNYLGLSKQEVIKLASEHGWIHENEYFRVKPIKEEKIQSTGIKQLEQLTEYFCYLEQQ